MDLEGRLSLHKKYFRLLIIRKAFVKEVAINDTAHLDRDGKLLGMKKRWLIQGTALLTWLYVLFSSTVSAV